jgi:hypothetical protein
VRRLAEALEWIAALGSDPTDGDEVRTRKRYLVTSAVLVLPAGVIWGLSYFAFGEPVAGSIPLGYSLFSAASIVAFARTRRFRVFRALQLVFILLLPFLLQISLGGFVLASAVVLWSAARCAGSRCSSCSSPCRRSSARARSTDCPSGS